MTPAEKLLDALPITLRAQLTKAELLRAARALLKRLAIVAEIKKADGANRRLETEVTGSSDDASKP